MYQPTRESLMTRTLPEWYGDAKLGIFIHWGLYSVPAWAQTGADISKLFKTGGIQALMANQPYSEWYMNSMAIPENPTYAYHRETYGDTDYYRFIEAFTRESSLMNADHWADLFSEAGAQYVVMVTKHHDGYVLWPSVHQNPVRGGMCTQRDFVGEVTEAVRSRGMRMGHYYSGVLDWSVRPGPIVDLPTMVFNQRHSRAYIEYANSQWKEIIDRYQTSVLWNDIGYPYGCDVNELFAYYYNAVEDGVINDRWRQIRIPASSTGRWLMTKAVQMIERRMRKEGLHGSKPKWYHDFETPEYAVFDEIRSDKWESCRGIGTSFAYNQLEQPEDMLTGNDLIWMLADVVSKNGNLLINVGPMADGTIPEYQAKPLRELGVWLSVNGNAIYGTTPWERAAGTLKDGTPVRFTQKDGTIYLIIQSISGESGEISLPEFTPPAGAVMRLTNGSNVPWMKDGDGCSLSIPGSPSEAPVMIMVSSE